MASILAMLRQGLRNRVAPSGRAETTPPLFYASSEAAAYGYCRATL